MLIATKKQTWQIKGSLISIKEGQSLDLLPLKEQQDALRLGYAIESNTVAVEVEAVDFEPEQIEVEPITEEIELESTESEEDKMYNPIEENKAIVPEENKDIEFIKRASRAKLIKFAEENCIEIKDDETREEIRDRILELYK